MVMPRAQVPVDTLRHLLTHKWSTRQFRMEYGGYLSNHLLHGVVALYELGADEPQIERYVDAYCVKLEPVKSSVPQEEAEPQVPWATGNDPASSLNNALHWRGARVGFEQLRHLYEQEIEAKGMDATVTKWLPSLVEGLAGSLFHGIIQLGYAYRIGNPLSVAEGLAYLHHSYLPFALRPQSPTVEDAEEEDDERGSNRNQRHLPITKDTVKQALKDLRSDTLLLEHLHEKVKSPPLCELPTSSLQKQLTALSSHDTLGEVNALQRIEDRLAPVLKLNPHVNGVVALDLALWLFTHLDCNDFVVVHAITSAWSLQQLEHLLVHPSKAFDQAWHSWLLAAFAGVLMREETHFVDEPWQYKGKDQDEIPSWDSIVAQTLALQYAETHVYKIVQVAMLHAQTNKTKSIESTSTSLLSNEERDLVCRKSALRVLTESFYIV